MIRFHFSYLIHAIIACSDIDRIGKVANLDTNS